MFCHFHLRFYLVLCTCRLAGCIRGADSRMLLLGLVQGARRQVPYFCSSACNPCTSSQIYLIALSQQMSHPLAS